MTVRRTREQIERAERRSEQAHTRLLLTHWNMTAGEYSALLEAQDGRCAICGNQPRRLRLAVDHDHTTGEIRGLLCKSCNHRLLGGAHDKVELLERAVAYMKHPPTRRVLF